MTSMASVRTKLLILGAVGIAALTWAGRAYATVSCDGSWSDDRAQSNTRTITFPGNSNNAYSPAQILINPHQTVVWSGDTPSDTFAAYPLTGVWGTFAVPEQSWPFTYQTSGPQPYEDQNVSGMAGIVCVTGPFVATFTHSPSPAKPNQTITFNGSDSHENWATLTDFKWDFGSGTFALDTGSTAQATHVFTKAGAYTVRLQITDDSGQQMIKSEKVTIGTVLTKGAKLASTTVKETAHGTVPLKIENPNAIAAKGRVTLMPTSKSGPSPIGSASFTDPAHGTVTVSVPLSTQAKSYLGKHSSLPAKAKIMLSGNNSSQTSVTTITIER